MLSLEPSENLSRKRLARVFITALGFEERAIFASQKLSKYARHKIALAFPGTTAFHYQSNQAFLVENDFEIAQYGDVQWSDRCVELIRNDKGDADAVGVDLCIDISSMSRPMIGHVTLLLQRIQKSKGDVRAKIVYCPAKYAPPPKLDIPIVASGPVLPQFAGWSTASGAPVAAVVGLGYEPDFALGTWEYLDAATLFAFFPTGEDSRYDTAVRSANAQVLDLIGGSHVYKYLVEEPTQLFIILNNLISGFLPDSRPIIVPFGPKIFAFVSMLVALNYYPNATVWRVSGDQTAPPTDRQPSGKIISFEVVG